MNDQPYEDWGASMPHGVGAHFYERLESTNAFAKEKASSGNKGPVWLIAGEQTGGRGRQGRNWVSKPGNLYCSLLFSPNLRPADLAPLPFIVSLAVRDTFVALGSDPDLVQCKWPNDVLIGGKKASGILIESSASGAGTLDYLVIGIGLNLLHHPDDAMFSATNLVEVTSKVTDVRTGISVLASKLKDRLDSWVVGEFEAIRTEWLAHAWGIGEKRQIRTSKETFGGTLKGLDEQGAVNVILEDGSEKTIYVADIFPSND